MESSIFDVPNRAVSGIYDEKQMIIELLHFFSKIRTFLMVYNLFFGQKLVWTEFWTQKQLTSTNIIDQLYPITTKNVYCLGFTAIGTLNLFMTSESPNIRIPILKIFAFIYWRGTRKHFLLVENILYWSKNVFLSPFNK